MLRAIMTMPNQYWKEHCQWCNRASPGSLTVAEIEVPLGRARARIKEFDGAQKVLDDAYKIRSEKLSKGDLLIADVISGQAELNMARGKTKEALSQLTEALAMITAKKGADSIEAATAQNNLGQAYQASGNLQKAEEMYQMALSARRNKLKDSSPLIADSLQCLGTLYAYTGRGKQALDCYKEAIAVQQKSLDATDPRLVNVQKKYAELLARMVGR
jgi:tetratricopeptide (TPR) repeat protein